MFVIVDNSKTHEECPSDDTHTQKMIEKRERPCVILADGALGALASLSSLAALAALKPTWKVSDLKFFFVCKTELKMNEFSDPT